MYELHGISDPLRSALPRASRNAGPFETQDGVEMSVETLRQFLSCGGFSVSLARSQLLEVASTEFVSGSNLRWRQRWLSPSTTAPKNIQSPSGDQPAEVQGPFGPMGRGVELPWRETSLQGARRGNHSSGTFKLVAYDSSGNPAETFIGTLKAKTTKWMRAGGQRCHSRPVAVSVTRRDLMSRIGGWPKKRLYSRLNWLALS